MPAKLYPFSHKGKLPSESVCLDTSFVLTRYFDSTLVKASEAEARRHECKSFAERLDKEGVKKYITHKVALEMLNQIVQFVISHRLFHTVDLPYDLGGRIWRDYYKFIIPQVLRKMGRVTSEEKKMVGFMKARVKDFFDWMLSNRITILPARRIEDLAQEMKNAQEVANMMTKNLLLSEDAQIIFEALNSEIKVDSFVSLDKDFYNMDGITLYIDQAGYNSLKSRK